MTLSRIMQQSWWACRERALFYSCENGQGGRSTTQVYGGRQVYLSAAEWLVEEPGRIRFRLIGMGIYQAIATAFREDRPFRGDCSTPRWRAGSSRTALRRTPPGF